MKKQQRQQRALARQRLTLWRQLAETQRQLDEARRQSQYLDAKLRTALELIAHFRGLGTKVIAFSRRRAPCNDCVETRWSATVLADHSPKRDAPGRVYMIDSSVSLELIARTPPDGFAEEQAAREARRRLADAVLEGL